MSRPAAATPFGVGVEFRRLENLALRLAGDAADDAGTDLGILRQLGDDPLQPAASNVIPLAKR
jgi:hypothetical protein